MAAAAKKRTPGELNDPPLPIRTIRAPASWFKRLRKSTTRLGAEMLLLRPSSSATGAGSSSGGGGGSSSHGRGPVRSSKTYSSSPRRRRSSHVRRTPSPAKARMAPSPSGSPIRRQSPVRREPMPAPSFHYPAAHAAR